jgi:uncharacterized protein (UPF0305 family)
MSYYNKYLKYKLKYYNLKYKLELNNSLEGGGKFNCDPNKKFSEICYEETNGKYKSKDSCINDCENKYTRVQLEKIKIFNETIKFYLFVKDIIQNENIKVYLKGGNVLGLKILQMIYEKYKNNDKKFKECFDEFLKLDLVKDWDLSAYTGNPITEEYRDKLDKIAGSYKLVPRAKTFILYQTKHPILLDDKPLFEISVLDNDVFSKLEIPLTTMKVHVNEYNLKYVFLFCKEFYAYKINGDPFDFDVIKRLLSKIKIIIHPYVNGIYKIQNNFDNGKLNNKLINFIKQYSKNDINLTQFLATHIEDPYRILYRLVSKNIKKNNKIKDFLKDHLNITNEKWLFDEKYITLHINNFTEKLGEKILDIYKDNYKSNKDIITSLISVEEFLAEISFNRIKSDYDVLEENGVKLLKNIFGNLIKYIKKEDLEKIIIDNKFIDFVKFLATKY